MDKTVIEYNIPIQDKDQCDKHNKRCKEMFGDQFTPAKPTEEHVDNLIEKLYNGIEKAGDAGGWYVGDGIKINIEITYEPEDK